MHFKSQGPPKNPGGTSGILGQIKDLGHLVKVLQPFFVPASKTTAPGGTKSAGQLLDTTSTLGTLADVKLSNLQDGDRLTYYLQGASWINEALKSIVFVNGQDITVSSVATNATTQTVTIASTVQRTKAALVAGVYTWTFSPAFVTAPVVLAFPFGTSAGNPTLFINGLSATAAVIQSTAATDVRTVHIVAFPFLT